MPFLSALCKFSIPSAVVRGKWAEEVKSNDPLQDTQRIGEATPNKTTVDNCENIWNFTHKEFL